MFRRFLIPGLFFVFLSGAAPGAPVFGTPPVAGTQNTSVRMTFTIPLPGQSPARSVQSIDSATHSLQVAVNAERSKTLT